MACDTMRRPGETVDQRKARAQASTARLEAALTAGTVKLKIGPQGAIAFEGWDAASRDGLTDACGFRRLTAKVSWALRQAVAKAEALAGRKVDQAAVNAGLHSHDGGKTWAKH